MVSPVPANPPDQSPTLQPLHGSAVSLPVGASTTRLRTVGFHVLAVLLGIALAFM
jgi:hypothetical protein